MAKASNQDDAGKTRSTDAAAADLAFSLQRTRFLWRLLQADAGESVCLEVFDDVRVLKADGSTLAEEDKSTHGRNPLADRSADLWKTLANWVNAAAAGHVSPPSTAFEIFVSRPVIGEFCKRFQNADSMEDAKSALLAVRDELWGQAPEFASRDKVSATISPFVEEVYGDGFEHAVTIVANLDVSFGSGDQYADLKPVFLAKLVSEDVYPDAVNWSHGWVKTRIDRLEEQDIPAIVSRDEFHTALLNYVQTHDRRDFLRSFAGDPTDSEVESQRFKPYVGQLEIVDADHDDILEAVNDYLRARADRTSWADRGDVNKRDLLDFENILKRSWKNLKGQVLLANKDNTEREQGQLIWLKCMDQQSKVNGLEVPSHFVPGSFHALADLLEIGWHPRYASELEEHRRRQSAAGDF